MTVARLKHERRAPARFAELAAGTPSRRGWPPSNATPETMARINAMPQVLRPLEAEDVFVRSMWAINDQRMHIGMRLEPEAVAVVSNLAVGVPVLMNHDTGTFAGGGALPVGRVFHGETVEDAGARWSRLVFWMPATEYTAELVHRIDGGAIGEVSVSIGYQDLTCSICKTDLEHCAHVMGEVYDDKTCEGVIGGVTDFYEVSLVWAGAAVGTSLSMAASRDRDVPLDVEVLAARELDALAHLYGDEGDRLSHLFMERPALTFSALFAKDGPPAP
jgi:hypothetical protein